MAQLGKVYDKLLDSTTQKRKVHKTVLHKSGRSLKSINKEMQLHFQYCSPNEKKKLNKQIWNMLHKAQMSSNEFQLNKYKHKVLTRVNDTTPSHVYANKGRGTCAMYPLSTLVNNRNKKGSNKLTRLSKSAVQCKQIIRGVNPAVLPVVGIIVVEVGLDQLQRSTSAIRAGCQDVAEHTDLL